MASSVAAEKRPSSDLDSPTVTATATTTDLATPGKIEVEAGDKHEVSETITNKEIVDLEAAPAVEEAQKHQFHKPPKKQFILIMVALILCVFLASLDQIIVSTCLPAIATEYQSLSEISWLGTAYLMTATSVQPLYGKFSDIFGRKATMIFGNVAFVAGSAVSGWATSMIMLIIGRGLAGLGAGGLLAMTFIILSDMLDMRERGKYIGAVGACFSLSSVLGPLLGGAFADHATWRWSFWINLPLTSISIIFIAINLNLPTPAGSFKDKIKRIDFLGSIVLMAAVILLLLPLSWGGTKYAWDSGIVIGLLVAGFVVLGLFFFVESKVAREPIFPIHLLKIRNVWATFGSLMFAGMAFFGVIYYLPLYYQVIKLESATIGGLETVPFVLGILVASVGSGIWVLKKGTFNFFPSMGLFIFAVGCGLCVLLKRDTPRVASIFILLLSGLGMGFTMQASVLAVQSAVEPKYMATITSSVQFVRSFGQVFGVAVVGSIFNNEVKSSLLEKFPSDPSILAVLQDYKYVLTYPEVARIMIWDSFQHSLSLAFYSCMGFCIVGGTVAAFIQHRELQTRDKGEKPHMAVEI